MKRTWMSTTAGILDIIGGCTSLLISLAIIFVGIFSSGLAWMGRGMPAWTPTIVFLIIGLPLLIAGILAIIGGASALKNRNWGMALTGSIAAFFPVWFIGVPAIVLTVLSREDFI